MNDTLRPEGIVPSAHVFGEFPSLRAFRGPIVPRPSLAERAEIVLEERRFMLKQMAAVQIKRATHHQTPTAPIRSSILINRSWFGGRKFLRTALVSG